MMFVDFYHESNIGTLKSFGGVHVDLDRAHDKCWPNEDLLGQVSDPAASSIQRVTQCECICKPPNVMVFQTRTASAEAATAGPLRGATNARFW